MSIEAQPGSGHVLITVTVGEKRAKLKVTPDYARKVGAELLTAAAQSEDKGAVPDFLRDLFKGFGG